MTCSAQSANHHGRIHGRFAKLGLATKVHLRDTSVDGISNSSSLWFYSIQGLFRVAFEYLDLEMQRHCLLNFTNLWLSSVSGMSQLPENLYLLYDASAQDAEVSFATVEHCWPDYTSSRTTSSQLEQTEKVGPCELDEAAAVTAQHGNGIDETASLLTEHELLYNEACHRLTCIVSKTEHTVYVERLCGLLKFFISDCCSEDCSHFPYGVLQQYVDAIDADLESVNGDHHISENKYDVTGRRGLMLRMLTSWLGAEFAGLRDTINSRVDDFKRRNIDRIDCLPSPRQTVDFIFPQCMVQLILCWMHPDAGEETAKAARRAVASEADECTEPDIRQICADHSYTGGGSQEYVHAFVQLILEFANNCLVSGIAHVLYPRLLQAQL